MAHFLILTMRLDQSTTVKMKQPSTNVVRALRTFGAAAAFYSSSGNSPLPKFASAQVPEGSGGYNDGSGTEPHQGGVQNGRDGRNSRRRQLRVLSTGSFYDPKAETDRPLSGSLSMRLLDVSAKLSNFEDTWDPYDETAVPMFWHIPKSGGSSIKNVIGGCHRLVIASEFGITDGHDLDAEVAVVYPRVPDLDDDADRSPFVNVDVTTVEGIARAKSMGFADAGLADAVVSPFVYETNDLFTPTAKGRIFSVFRHPVDRAVSMFYYIQVADWEPSYRPDLKNWTLSQYAQSDIMENNWITRQLSNQPTGDLTEDHLTVAMNTVRSKILVGLTNKIGKSMDRFEKFFRWKYRFDPSAQEECRREMMIWGSNSNKNNQREIPIPGDEAYIFLAHQNNFDIRLYEYIESLFEEQEAFVTGHPIDYRKVGATCCECDPPTYMEEGMFKCPQSVKNARRNLR